MCCIKEGFNFVSRIQFSQDCFSFLKTRIFLFSVYDCLPICICAHNMYSGQKRALDLLELELQKVVSFSMCLSVSCWNHTVLITITHSTYTVG